MSVEKKESKTRRPVSFEAMVLVMIDLLDFNSDAILQVQHAKTGEIFNLALNSVNSLCLVEPMISGKSLKLLDGRFGDFVMTDETVDTVIAHAESMEAKRKSMIDSYVSSTGAQYSKIIKAVAEVGESKKLADESLVGLLDKLKEYAPGFKVYRDKVGLYFVCTCKSDQEGAELRGFFSEDKFEVWGKDCNVHIKKAYSEDEIWKAKCNHGLEVKN